MGIVPCRVTAENGPIAVGDLLVIERQRPVREPQYDEVADDPRGDGELDTAMADDGSQDKTPATVKPRRRSVAIDRWHS